MDDWLHLLEIQTALIRALPDVTDIGHRRALAAYLRRLRASHAPGAEVRLATAAGELLPRPHAWRLLRWAKARLERPRAGDHANINWFWTPPDLAIAFARQGDLEAALAVAERFVRDPIATRRSLGPCWACRAWTTKSSADGRPLCTPSTVSIPTLSIGWGFYARSSFGCRATCRSAWSRR